MALACSLLAVFCLSLGLPLLAGVKVGKHVTKLNEEKFNHWLKSPKRQDMLVEFFAPWCSACKSFAPNYRRSAEMIRKSELPVKVIAIDCDAEAQLANKYGIQSFPTIMYFPLEGEPVPYGSVPKTPSALFDWVEEMHGPAIKNVSSPDQAVAFVQGGSKPVVIVKAPQIPPDVAKFAQATRQAASWFWVFEFTSLNVEIRHWEEPVRTCFWPKVTGGDVQIQLEPFAACFARHLAPKFAKVTRPAEITGLGGRTDSFIWLLLNTSTPSQQGRAITDSQVHTTQGCSASGHKESASSCSMNSAPQADAVSFSSDTALEAAVSELRPMMLEAAEMLTKENGFKEDYHIVYVDGSRYEKWAERELYAWRFPQLVVQNKVGNSYAFADGERLPHNASELRSFVHDLEVPLKVRPRMKSQKPPDTSGAETSWKQLVSDTLHSELRASPATLLYVSKTGPRDELSTPAADAAEDELDALDDLAAWLKHVCTTPPAVGLIDASLNEIPLSLYAMADFSLVSLPGIFFIPSDHGKLKYNYWGAKIFRYQLPNESRPKEEQTEKEELALPKVEVRLLSKHLDSVAQWTLENARSVSGLDIPSKVAKSGIGSTAGKGQPVIELDSGAFNSFLKSGATALVEFYAPWCAHCKNLAPTFESAARGARRASVALSEVIFVKIDGEKSPDLMKRYRIENYPTLILVKGSQIVRYSGDKSKRSMLEWLEAEVRPTVEIVAREAEAVALSKGKPAVIIQGGNNHSAFSDTAEQFKHLRKARFFEIEGTSSQVQEIWIMKAGKEPVKYEGEFDVDSITEWVTKETVMSQPVPQEQLGPVVEVVGRSFPDIVFQPRHVIVEVYATWCGHCKDLEPIYESFASQMRHETRDIVIARIEGSRNEIPYAGFDRTGYPTIFYVSPSNNVEKIQQRTLNDLVSFVRSKKVRKVETEHKQDSQLGSFTEAVNKFKSEDIPPMSTDPVVKVVFRNFIDVVFQSKDDVVLEVFAPWCAHCKRLVPEYEQFAVSMKRERKDLLVAKIDGTKNDIPFDGFSVNGFPTIFYIPKGQKVPAKKFVGDKSIQQMAHFLQELRKPKNEL